MSEKIQPDLMMVDAEIRVVQLEAENAILKEKLANAEVKLNKFIEADRQRVIDKVHKDDPPKGGPMCA